MCFYGLYISHEGYVCYDPCSNRFHKSHHVVFYENQYLFPTHVAYVPDIHVFPYFDDSPSTPERFNPGFVYK
jgi:hypothetical protein